MPGTGPPLQNVPQQWKHAVIGGLIALPFTALGYWQTGSELSLFPVLFGGLLAGYLAKRRIGESRGVGIRAGLVGGLPVIWVLFDILTVGVTVAVAVFGFGLAALIGAVGARIGSWLAGKQPGQPTPALDQ